MTDPDSYQPQPSALPDEALQDEARAWLRRLTSGTATRDDAEGLATWRGKSAAHAKAFAEAALLWNVLGEATQDAVARNTNIVSLSRLTAKASLPRRAFIIGGGAALAASLAGLAIMHPPLDLWPSLPELKADYRTRTGERRQIDVADSVSVDLNTQTSIGLHPATAGTETIELIAGEAVIAKRTDPFREFVVLAGAGQVGTSRASFNIRRDGNAVCVTCIDGDVRVQHRQGTVMLRDRQTVTYDDRGLSQIAKSDPDVVTAWREGLLVFRDVPLARVIAEVNRYRAGRIVLLDAQLGRRQVVANFRLDRLEDVITFVTQVMNAPVRSLPGGIVLLG